jgi:hypothetical protein
MTTPETEQATPPVTPAPVRRKRRRLVRDFMMQLVPVTAGVLIALLIDGALELRRENKLVAEAHAAIWRQAARHPVRHRSGSPARYLSRH